jgi:hypothetical protein
VTHPLVTDEMASTAWDRYYLNKWSEPSIEAMRAALEAVADDIVEACANAIVEANMRPDCRRVAKEAVLSLLRSQRP